MNVYDFTARDIQGNDTKLDAYKGKWLLVVNVASKCGLTPQYTGLESLYKRYKDKGLTVLGFRAISSPDRSQAPRRTSRSSARRTTT
jgi:glutathione peroxidase-family protein